MIISKLKKDNFKTKSIKQLSSRTSFFVFGNVETKKSVSVMTTQSA